MRHFYLDISNIQIEVVPVLQSKVSSIIKHLVLEIFVESPLILVTFRNCLEKLVSILPQSTHSFLRKS
jgi:hypothetical protein